MMKRVEAHSMERIRVLGIAPYEGMKTLMTSLANEYPQIELTTFVGDLEQGAKIARNNFHGDYDVVISRGGTAQLLQQQLPLPVIEIEISIYDILSALKLAGGLTGKVAIVSFADTTSSAKMLGSLMGYNLDIYTLHSQNEVAACLGRVQQEGYSAILCDMIAHTTAKRLGLNSFLITSGIASIRQAFSRALQLCRSQERLKNENLFLRQLVNGQLCQTVVFDENGELFLSTVMDAAPGLMDLLRQELQETKEKGERRIRCVLGGTLYNIQARCLAFGEKQYVAFFFNVHKMPLPAGQTGIRYFSRKEAEQTFDDSVYSFADTVADYQQKIDRMSQSKSPVIVTGEPGTGKESLAHILYMRGPFRNGPLVCIRCGQLCEKSWNFLLEHHNSPLSDEGSTLFFSNIDMLTEERRHGLLAVLVDMDVCRRNKVIFSCVCRPGETLSATGALFADKLHCLSFFLPPLRTTPECIPTLVNLWLNYLNADMPSQITGIEPEAMLLLQQFPWPYNNTQLRRVVEELAVTSPGPVILTERVREALRREQHVASFAACAEDAASPLDLNRPLSEINRDIVRLAVKECGGNQTAAAKRLGISRTTLWRLLKE